MVQQDVLRKMEGIIQQAKSPQRLSEVRDIVQQYLFDRGFGGRIEFPSRLDNYLQANYPEDDRDTVYKALVQLAIRYDKKTP